MNRFGIIATLLICGSAFGGEQQLATYPKTVHTRIGNDLVINGEYYRMAYFTTSDPIKVVARHFLDTWTKEGYPTQFNGDWTQEAIVSAFYTREGLMRSVVLRNHGDKTVGFTVIKDLWVQAARRDPPALITLEGTLFSNDLSSRDSLTGAVNRTALVQSSIYDARINALSGYEVQGFELRREIGSKQDGKQQYTLEFARDKEDIVIHLGEVAEDLTAVSTTASLTRAPETAPNPKANNAMRAPKAKIVDGKRKAVKQ